MRAQSQIKQSRTENISSRGYVGREMSLEAKRRELLSSPGSHPFRGSRRKEGGGWG